MSDDLCVRKREDRLVARERSYRAARFGAVVLAVLMLVVVPLTPARDDTHTIQAMLIGGAAFWIAVVVYIGEKLSHVRTIKRYRALMNAENQQDATPRDS